MPRSTRSALARRVGGVGFHLVIAAVVVLLGVRWVVSTTSGDIRQTLAEPSGQGAPTLPASLDSQVVRWLAPGIQGDTSTQRIARADRLDQRADRLGETAGTLALAGVLLALVTPDRGNAKDGQGSGQVPASSTSSSGSP